MMCSAIVSMMMMINVEEVSSEQLAGVNKHRADSLYSSVGSK